MVVHTKEHSKMVNYKDQVKHIIKIRILIKMLNILDSLNKVKNMDMENIIMEMVEVGKDNGPKTDKTVLANIKIKKVI
jgi:hypothetical protein